MDPSTKTAQKAEAAAREARLSSDPEVHASAELKAIAYRALTAEETVTFTVAHHYSTLKPGDELTASVDDTRAFIAAGMVSGVDPSDPVQVARTLSQAKSSR